MSTTPKYLRDGWLLGRFGYWAAHGVMLHHFHEEGPVYQERLLAEGPCGASLSEWVPAEPRRAPSQGSISAESFHALIDHVRPRPAREWLSEPGGAVLTLDDGLLAQWELARPCLAARGLTAIWHVNSGSPRLELYRQFRGSFPTVNAFYTAFYTAASDTRERYPVYATAPDDFLADRPFYTAEDRQFRWVRDHIMTEERYHNVMDRMIAASRFDPGPLLMDKRHWWTLHEEGHVIGLHTHAHPTRPMRDEGRMRQEWSVNRRAIFDAISAWAPTAAYPCGHVSSLAERDLLAEFGVKRAFLATPEPIAIGDEAEPRMDDPLRTPRIDHAVIVKEMGL